MFQRLFDYYNKDSGLWGKVAIGESPLSKRPRKGKQVPSLEEAVGKGKQKVQRSFKDSLLSNYSQASSSGDHPDDLECSICHCVVLAPMMKWVKCLAGCIFCIPCFTKRFHDRIAKKIINTECFLKCGEVFSNETLKKYLAPVLFEELEVAPTNSGDKVQDDDDNDAVVDVDVDQISNVNNNQNHKHGEDEDDVVIEHESIEKANDVLPFSNSKQVGGSTKS